MAETATITTDDGFEISSSTESADEMRVTHAVEPAAAAAVPAAAATTDDDDPAAAAPITDRRKGPPVAVQPDRRTPEGRKQSIQQQIDELTTVKHQTRRELDADTAKLAALRSELSALEGQRATKPERALPPVASADDPEPTIEQFAKEADPYTAWMRELHRWDSRQEWKKQEAAARQRTTIQHIETLRDNRGRAFNEALVEHAKTDPTWTDRVDPDILNAYPLINLAPNEKGTYLNAIAEVAFSRPTRAAAILQACSEPATRQRLSTLPQDEFYLEMGIIVARLEAASTSGPASKPPVITKAKPLIKPVSTSPVVSDDGAEDDEDDLSEAAVNRHIRQGNAADPQINPRAVRR